jgi:hypothetical protein
MAKAFSPEGIAAVVDEEGWAYIDRSGRIVIRPFVFDNGPDYFAEGLAAVCDGCREVAEGEHRGVKGGRWGFINRAGNLVIPLQFEEAGRFKKGRAHVKLGGHWKYVDQNGAVMSETSIGVARMEPDGTIVLQLRAEGPGRSIGDALIRYPVGHQQYAEILKHLGGLEKGQSKPVPPWPDK